MTKFAADSITQDRLKRWTRKNQQANVICTPAVLISIRHDPEHLGQLVLNTVDARDISDENLLKLLALAMESLKAQIQTEELNENRG